MGRSWIYLLIGLTLAFGLFWMVTLRHQLDFGAVWEYRSLFFKGWLNTIWISCASLVLSLIIGFLTALMQRSHLAPLIMASKVYIELIRGTPLLVQTLFFFYVIADVVGLDNRYVSGVLVLSIFHGAYLAEMIRAGLDNVSATQLESARAIGLTTGQSYRFVIIPQAARQVLPPLTGQFASIIKDSSLLSVIGINELTNAAQQINSATYSTLETFFPLGLAYLALTLPISLWSKKLEASFHYES